MISIMEENCERKFEFTPCDPCRTVFDKINERGVGFCVTCVEYLCISCVNHHRKLKATRNHTLLSGNELPGSKAPFEMLEVIGKCTNHPDEEIAYECQDHQQFLCLNCAKTKHLSCANLTEIALHDSNESDRLKLSGVFAKLKLNEEKVDSIKCHKMQKNKSAMNERDEILDKQRYLKMKLENALRDIEKQHEQIQCSFARKLEKTNVDIKRLDKIKERIALNGQFAQLTLKYASPAQLYIVASGHFQDVDNLLEGFQTDNKPSESDVNITDINDDILNLLLTVDISKHILDSSSDSVDGDWENASDIIDIVGTASKACQTQHTETITAVSKPSDNTTLFKDLNKLTSDDVNVRDILDGKTASPEACGNVMNDMPITTDKEPLKKRQSLMLSSAVLASTLIVNCPGDTKPCDIVGITTLNGNELIYVVDYANTKLKVFDNHLKFIFQKSLHSKPCGICSLDNEEIAVLLTEKSIAVYDVLRLEAKPLRSIMLNNYGHSITRYNDNIAVMCSESKFDGIKDNIKLPITLEIYDHIQCTKIHEMPFQPRNVLRNPCQIYSRADKEIILSTESDITSFKPDGATRWYYRHGELLQKTAGMASDIDGNLYICGYKSNNIHQISKLGYFYAKVIVSGIQRPWSITFNNRSERMIVACRKQDHLFVYTFK